MQLDQQHRRSGCRFVAPCDVAAPHMTCPHIRMARIKQLLNRMQLRVLHTSAVSCKSGKSTLGCYL